MSDNTASNLGTGQGIFAQKVGDDLQFKGLVGGTNVTLTADANNITITASNDTTALNLGTGNGLFTSKSGDNLQLKSIIGNADSGISVISNSNDLTLQLNANVDAGKLGGVAASDFLRKSDNLASVASVATARSNLSVYSKAEIDANTVKLNASTLPATDITYSLGNNSYKWLNIYAQNFFGRATTAGSIDAIGNINDVDVSGAVNGSVLKYNSSTSQWEIGTDNSGGGGGGSSTFVGLSDTPGNFTGDANKFVRVNSGENALEFTSDVATQTYVNTQVANLVDSAPGTLDTLNELAAALGDDANFATTVTNSIATKLATADFNTTFDNRLATKSTTNLTEGTNLYYTDARVDTHLNQSNPTSGYVLSWNGSDYAWVANGGSGDISRVNITAGTGLTGTQDTTTGDHTQTLNVDVGTTAGKIVQLDGSGRLPAVDGSQLTGVSTTTTLAGLTDTTIGTAANGEVLFYNGSAWVDQALTTDNVSEGGNLYYTNARADARIGAANISDLANVHTAAPTDGQVLKWDNGNGRWAPANDADTVYTSFNSDFDTRLASKDTGDLTEGSNLYFTNARADARVQAASLTDLSNVDAVVAGDDGKVLYYDHSSTSFKWKTESGALADTDALSEGSTNLYFTNARATSAITGSNLNMGSNDITTTGKIYYANMFATEGDLPNATTYHGMFAHVHATGAGYFAHGGNWIKLANNSQLSNYQTTAGLNGAIDSHLNQSNPTAGYVLSWNGSDYAWVDNGTTGATAFTGLTDTPANYTSSASRFVKVNSAGNGLEFVADPGYLTSVPAQSFASLTGKPTTIAGYGITDAFSGAYADLTGKPTLFDNSAFDTRLATKDTGDLAEGSNLYFTNARADARITAAGSANWNTAYGWGDHSAAGYQTTAGLNGAIDSHLNQSNPTAGYVLSWNGSDYAWIDNSGYTNTDFDNRLATKTTDNLTEGSSNLYFTNARARAAISEGSAQLSYNSGTGVLTFTQGDTDTVSEGSTNLYFTNARADARADARIAAADTDALSEGSTNLYYTDARADARITNALIDEDNMATNSATRIPSQQSVKAYVDSQVASENELSEMNDVTISSIQNNQFLKYNSSSSRWENATVTAATAAGSDTYVQFNDGGIMGGDAGFVYNKTTDALTVGSVTTTGSSPQVSAAGNLGISTTASNGNITITPHSTGDIILDGQKWPQADGSANQYLKTNGAGQLSWDSLTTDDVSEGANLYYTDARARAAISEGSAQLSYNSSTGVLTFTQDDTDGIAEGSSNLYFTDARAISAVQGTNLNMGSNNITTTGKILYSNVYSAEGDLPNASTYHGMFAHVHGTGAGYFAHGGNWIKLANNSQLANSANWDTAYGWGNHASAGYLTSETFTSVVQDTTPQLGGTLDANGNIIDMGSNNITDAKVGQWDTAYGWGNHGAAGYLTNITGQSLTSLSNVDAVAASDDGKVLYYDHSSTSFKWKTDATGGGTLNTAGNTGTGSVTLASETLQVLGTTGQINVDAAAFALSLSLASDINSITSIAFEGSTSDTNETKLQAVDPTADRTINLPDASGHLPVFASASPAAIADGTNGQALVTNGNGQLSFTTISGGSDLNSLSAGTIDTQNDSFAFIDADDSNNSKKETIADLLTAIAGSGISVSGGQLTASGGGGGTTYEEFKINYATNGNISSISDTSSGISGVNIDSAAGGDLTVTFTGYTTPPLSLMMYGYIYSQNKYSMNTLGSTGTTLREIPGGGSSGSPTAFGSFSSLSIKAREAETGASRSFGTSTHAWVRFVMGA